MLLSSPGRFSPRPTPQLLPRDESLPSPQTLAHASPEGPLCAVSLSLTLSVTWVVLGLYICFPHLPESLWEENLWLWFLCPLRTLACCIACCRCLYGCVGGVIGRPMEILGMKKPCHCPSGVHLVEGETMLNKCITQWAGMQTHDMCTKEVWQLWKLLVYMGFLGSLYPAQSGIVGSVFHIPPLHEIIIPL